MDLVTEYLKLGLRFDRVVDGFVDSYIGDPALEQQVADEPTPDPAQLSRRAAELSAQVPDAGLSPDRADFLTAHLDALTVAGRRLAGEPMSFIDEVQLVLPGAHRPGGHRRLRRRPRSRSPTCSIRPACRREQRPRRTAWRPCGRPRPARRELVETAVRALAAALRERVAGAGRAARPGNRSSSTSSGTCAWSGFNYYLGDFSSRVAVNADVDHRMSQFPVLVAHECYPGHHTEHCRKEKLLVRAGGQAEQTIFLVNTPQSLMAEGLGDLALTAAVGPGWAAWAAEVLDGIGPRFEPELAEALELASRPLNTVRQNAAIMLHDRGADADDVVAYLQRWSLVDEKRARGTAALHVRPAVAGLHLHLRRGRAVAAALAGGAARRIRAPCSGSSGCWTSR